MTRSEMLAESVKAALKESKERAAQQNKKPKLLGFSGIFFDWSPNFKQAVLESHRRYTALKAEKIRETEKAVLLKIGNTQAWFPKKTVAEGDGFFNCDNWLLHKNGYLKLDRLDDNGRFPWEYGGKYSSYGWDEESESFGRDEMR